MKYPKLKQTVLCQVLLYLPSLSFFLWIAALSLIPGTWKDCVPVTLGGFFLFGGGSLWYLFHNFALLFSSDMLFSMIRQWKKDRAEYRTFRNGGDRPQIRKTILRRCARWGKCFEMPTNPTSAVDIYYRNGYSWTIFWSAIEKRVAVCTTDILSVEQYRLLTGQARRMLSAVPHGKPRFKTKRERNAPRAQANVILILADTVDDEVKALARKPLAKTEEFCILPCVIQCSGGYYYTNCTAEYYEQGMMPRPVENFAAAMIRQLVFARRLPKENRDTQPVYAFTSDIDMSLWEYCKTFGDKMHEADDALKKDRTKAFHRMRNGEARIGDGVIWYKRDNRLAEYAFVPDDEDEMLVTLIPDEVWYYKKDEGFLFSVLFRSSLNRRKMKKSEPEQVQKSMETKLIAEGYRIARE